MFVAYTCTYSDASLFQIWQAGRENGNDMKNCVFTSGVRRRREQKGINRVYRPLVVRMCN
jgi:hypothetical protein